LKQPLATIENYSITNEPEPSACRRTPSLADGLLVANIRRGCHRRRLTTRRLRWALSIHAQRAVRNLESRGAALPPRPFQQVQSVTSGSKWLDSTVTIADGSVRPHAARIAAAALPGSY